MRFEAFADRKRRDAEEARLDPVQTLFESGEPSRLWIGNGWTRGAYNGDFGLQQELPGDVPAVSLVFVQSGDGNTVIGNPGDLGAGPTDEHLLYEGLTRVAADGVVAGAGSIGANAFFSVWHPELVSLRLSLGLPRHPAQIVISGMGRLDFDALLFNVPEIPTFLCVVPGALARFVSELTARPWLQVVEFTGDIRSAFMRLRSAGLTRLSAVGGRTAASSLVDAGLVQDLYLTTSGRPGGKPGTGWYAGDKRVECRALTRKQWTHDSVTTTFEHLALAESEGQQNRATGR